MKKLLITIFSFAALLLTSCAQKQTEAQSKAESYDTVQSSEVTETDAESFSETDSISSANDAQLNSSASEQEKCIRIIHAPCAPDDDSRKCYVTDETTMNEIADWVSDTKDMLSDEYVVEFTDTNSLHSALEGYSIAMDFVRPSTPREENMYFITVDDIDGYNFAYNMTYYNLPKEHIDQILDIIPPLFAGKENAKYSVQLAQDIDVEWYITDNQATEYLDDFLNNYLPQLDEISGYDRSEIRNGDGFASVYFNDMQLNIRQFSDNIYDVSLIDLSKDTDEEGYEKFYLIPQDKLDELINIIKSTQPQ